MVAEISPRLDNGRGLQNFGLSRLCEVFLGKQLDKAEQCSDWLIRPLSPEQIEYAALDAWACAAIQSKIQIMDAFSGDSVQQVALSECN
jgi:ribonuclease D